jgi:23S rRNA (uracil1939-C5)-methyltransferase
MSEIVEITELGAQGDGVARLDGQPVFVPYAAPGDRVRVEIAGAKGDGREARLLELIAAGPRRATPVCRHFTNCGGCATQHVATDFYRDWKRSLVAQALAHRGLEMPAETRFIALPPATRRRATFAARKANGVLHFGFHAPESHVIVDLVECHVLTPTLLAALPMLRRLVDAALADGQEADLTATESDTGLDLLFAAALVSACRRVVFFAAAGADIARLSWKTGRGAPEPLLQHRVPQISFGGAVVDLPPDSFLQPSREGEAVLVAAVIGFTKGKAIADLYAGCGTFTFPLAKIGKVAAFEFAKPAVAALSGGVNRAQLSGRVTATARDLDQSPLPLEDLKRFDCVVFDPPRAGAKAQAEVLTKSKVKRVVAVSCNPASFARDARILIDGGYRLKDLVVVDQFVWSTHVELVARFDR